MRHLDQIMKEKSENDAVLAKAMKRRDEIDDELKEMYNAVVRAMERGTATE